MIKKIQTLLLLILFSLSSYSQTITVNNLIGPFCSGAAINVIYSASSSGFNNDNIFTAQLSDATGSFATPLVTGTGTSPISLLIPVNATTSSLYKIKVISSSPITSDSTATFQIKLKPSVTVGNVTSPICSGNNITLTSTPSGGNGTFAYSWSGPNSYSSTIEDPTITNATAAASGSYNVVVTSNGCSATATVNTVTVNTLPSISSKTASICSGEAFTIAPANGGSDIVPSGTQYTWTNPTGSITGGSAQNSLQNNVSQTLSHTTNSNQTATYTVTASTNGCTDSFTATVTVKPLPTVTNVTDLAKSICSGSAFNVAPANGSGNIIPTGTTYTWSNPTVTGSIIGGSAQSTGQSGISQNLSHITNVDRTATYTISAAANGCANNFTSVITVKPLPTVNNASDLAKTICTGSAFTIAPTNGSGNIIPTGTTYTWTNPTVTGSIIGGSAQSTGQSSISQTLSHISNVDRTATYTITAAANGCANNFSSIITVNPKPNVILGALASPICSGSDIGLICTPSGGTGTYSFLWSGPNSYSATSQNSIISNATTSAAGSYTVVVTSGTCITTATANTNSVIVNQTPSITSKNASICSGEAFVITPANVGSDLVPTGTQYSWINPSGSITGGSAQSAQSSVSQTLSHITNTNQTATYNVTASSNSCTSNFTATVTVKPLPTVTNTSDLAKSICSGSAFAIAPVNASGNIIPIGTTYTWSAPSVTGSITGGSAQAIGQTNVSQTLSHLLNSNNTATYSATVSANGCSTNFTSVVTVKPLPTVIYAADLSESVCSASSFTIAPVNGNGNIIPSSGVTYTWTNPTVTGSIIGGSAQSGQSNISQTLTHSSNIDRTATYTVTISANGCSTNFTPIITVKPLPKVINSTDLSTSVCSGSAFAIAPIQGAGGNIIPTSGVTYSWTNPTVSGSITGGSAQSNQSNISQTLSHLLNVNQTATYNASISANGCSTNFTSVVTVKPLPTVINASDLAKTICSGTSFSIAPLQATGGNIIPTGTTYTWTTPIVTGGINGANAQATGQITISQTLTNTLNTGQTATYNINATANGCSNTLTPIVTVNPTPVIASKTASACSGSTFVVSPTNTGADIVPSNTTYTWVNPLVTGGITGGSAQSTGQANISQTLTNPGTGNPTATYTITPTSGVCQGNNFTAVVTIQPSPNILTTQSTSVCSGTQLNFIPPNGGGVIVPSGTTFTWVNPSLPIGLSGGSAQSTAQTSLNQTLTNTSNTSLVAVYYVTPFGCNQTGSSFTVNVTVNPSIVVTNQTVTICSGSTFNVNPTNGAGNIVPNGINQYSWATPTLSGSAGDITGASSLSNQSSISQTLINTTNTFKTAVYQVSPLTAAGCSGSNFLVTVTVNPKPTIATINQSSCSGVAFSILTTGGVNIIPTGTTYSWLAPSGAAISGGTAGTDLATIGGNLSNSTNTPQTATYTITPTAGACSGNQFSASVTINPTPEITSKTATICSGETFVVTPTNGAGDIVPTNTTYTWTNPTPTGGVTGGSAQSTGQGSISQILINPTSSNQTLTYAVTATANGCSSSTFALIVTIKPKPAVTNVSDLAKTICSGTSFNIAPTDGGGNIIPAGTTYTWTAPTFIAGNITGTTAQSVGIGNISQTLTNTTNASQTATYNATVFSNGCSSTFTSIVTLNPRPFIASAINATAVCSGSSFNAAPTNTGGNIIPLGTTYKWILPIVPSGVSGGSAQILGVSAITDTLFHAFNIPQTATYTVTATAGSCTATNTFNVIATVNPGPSVSNPNDLRDTICSGTPFTINPQNGNGNNIPSSGLTYTWTAPAVTGGILGGSSGNSANGTISQSLSNPNNENDTATYTITISAGGCSSPFTTAIIVKPRPSITTISAEGCSGSQITVNLTNGSGNIVPAGTNYSWSAPTVTGSISGATGSAASTNIIQTLTNPTNSDQTATYSVTSTADGCSSSTPFSLVLTSKPKPVVSTQSATICSGDAFIISPINGNGNIIPANISYSWPAPIGINITGYSADSNQPQISQTLISDTNISRIASYNVTAISNGCSSSIFAVTVTVKPTPLISVIDATNNSSAKTCSGVAFNVIPSNGNGNIVPLGTTYSAPITNIINPATIVSTINSMSGQNLSDTLTHFASGDVTVTYNITPTSNGCVGNPFQLIITIQPAPNEKPLFTFYNSYGKDSISSQPIELCSGTQNFLVNVKDSSSAFTYSWNFKNLGTGVENNFDNANKALSFNNPGEYNITLTATNKVSTCSSKSIPLTLKVSESTSDIVESTIDIRQTGQVLLYNDNTVDSYQWGVDDSISRWRPKNILGQIYQSFVPDNTYLDANNKLKSGYHYWVNVKKGNCESRVYYNGPYSKKRVIKYQQVSDSLFVFSYPNPAKDNVDLTVSGNIYGTISIQLYSALGAVVYEATANKIDGAQKYTMNLEQLSKGIYYVVVSGSYNERISTKIQKY